MKDNVLIACHKCEKNFNIPLDEARQYNKNNHYICSDCSNIKKEITTRSNESDNQSQVLPSDIVPHVEPYVKNVSPSYRISEVSSQSETPRTLSDYEHIASNKVKAELDEIKQRREKAERAYQAEQTRVANQRDEGGFSLLRFLPAIVGLVIGIIVILGVMNTVDSSINCNTLKDTQTQQACASAKSVSWAVVGIIPIVLFFVLFGIFSGIGRADAYD